MTAFDLGDDSNAPEATPSAAVAPHDLAVAEPGVAISHVADAERHRLRAELAEIGGPSSLLRYIDEPEIGIDITKAHPSSLPTFITGQSTLLSNLFRDEVALLQARRAAEAITAKNVELRTVRGINAVHLAVGLATWVKDGTTFTAPVLLRPLAIRRRGMAGDGPDFELKLQGGFGVNPELVTVLEEHFGIGLDGESLALLAHADGVFKPQPVIDRLRGLTAHIESFTVRPRLVVSTFADVARGLVRDLTPGRRDPLEHRVLDALAGHPADREALAGTQPDAVVTNPDLRAPANDTLLLDADDEQEAVIAAIAAGRSFTVATLPGTGGTQTVVNAIGSLVGEHKRVLVVSPRRSTLEGIRLRLSKIGLPGLAVTPPTVQRDLIRAIGRNEKAAAPPLAEVDEALVRLRSVLLDYRGALTQQHPQLGVSPLETLRELTRICTADPTLITRTRLEAPALAAIAADREGAAQKLALAAGLLLYGMREVPEIASLFARADSGRFELWRILFAEWLDCGLWLGCGVQYASQATILDGAPIQHPHNIYMALGLYSGLVSLLLFLALNALLLRRAWQQRDPWGLYLLVALLMLNFDGSKLMGNPDELWLLVLLPMALIANRRAVAA